MGSKAGGGGLVSACGVECGRHGRAPDVQIPLHTRYIRTERQEQCGGFTEKRVSLPKAIGYSKVTDVVL